MKTVVGRIAQLIVGVLFIFSGWIKMNDPMGFSFKLEEYFSPAVLDLPVFTPWALELSIIIVIAEVLLGVMLLLGVMKRLTLWLLTAMIVFFTFLTFYSAYFDVVKDCGCFGDAIKLTPWGSFTKDLVLLVLILALWWAYDQWFVGLPKKLVNIAMGVAVVASLWFTNYVLTNLPYIDFRPYAIGNSIPEGMKTAEELGLKPPVYDVIYTMQHNETGEQVEITGAMYTQDRWWEKEEYTMLSDLSRTVLVEEGYEPPVHDFAISTDWSDITDSVLALDNIWLLISYNRPKTNDDAWEGVLETAAALAQSGQSYVILSASSPLDYEGLGVVPGEHKWGTVDETTLKTIVRSNPGWVQLNNGVVVQKFHHSQKVKY